MDLDLSSNDEENKSDQGNSAGSAEEPQPQSTPLPDLLEQVLDDVHGGSKRIYEQLQNILGSNNPLLNQEFDSKLLVFLSQKT